MVTSRGRVRGIVANTRSRGAAPVPPASDTLPVGVTSTAWSAGGGTTMTFPTDQRVRCASSAGGNPRVVKQLLGLTIGATYRVEMNITKETALELYFRIGNDPGIASGYFQTNWTTPISRDVSFDFVPDQVTCYLGFIPIVSGAGQYSEGSKFIKVTKL